MHGWILWTVAGALFVIACVLLSFFGTLAYWCYKFLKEGDGHG